MGWFPGVNETLRECRGEEDDHWDVYFTVSRVQIKQFNKIPTVFTARTLTNALLTCVQQHVDLHTCLVVLCHTSSHADGLMEHNEFCCLADDDYFV